MRYAPQYRMEFARRPLGGGTAGKSFKAILLLLVRRTLDTERTPSEGSGRRHGKAGFR